MILATCILFRLMQQKEKYISGIPAHSVQSGQRTVAKGGPSKRWRFSIVFPNDGNKERSEESCLEKRQESANTVM